MTRTLADGVRIGSMAGRTFVRPVVVPVRSQPPGWRNLPSGRKREIPPLD